MLKSMTGFGRGEYIDSTHRIIVEIKAVNHRYNEIVIRMPKALGSLEDKVRRGIANTILRGRVDTFITVDEYGQKKRTVRVDKDLAMAYHNAMGELAGLLGVPASDNVYHLSKYPDVLKVEEISEDVEKLWPKLATAIESAVLNLMKMREAEGANIENDLLARVEKLYTYIATVEERAPQILVEYREKLLGRMRELLAAVGAEPDETRLLQETAIFADRTNVTEEIVRLKSHLSQFKAAVKEREAVGRKLDFIVQEINRETNTIASKANDSTIANVVVEIKSEIEKVREQIQNIE
ncbi:YicC/YloC family endoribonuclease [Sporomusa malonica]|uniref:TIGR00255 family protein n=1 Tax=Sporomusa malonica TaxID=112901 RepID=A0A1W2A5R7_9FIRM|nr:YicC/YloC family endoribonuclease [Sporomusa malonica]SMC56079.1 TIGR00255 family protein [Sporomusa malonica]